MYKCGEFLHNINNFSFNQSSLLQIVSSIYVWFLLILGLDYVVKFGKVKSEMKAILGLFAIEHLALCTPMFILSYNIYLRNCYLDTLYGQLPEEQVRKLILELLLDCL